MIFIIIQISAINNTVHNSFYLASFFDHNLFFDCLVSKKLEKISKSICFLLENVDLISLISERIEFIDFCNACSGVKFLPFNEFLSVMSFYKENNFGKTTVILFFN